MAIQSTGSANVIVAVVNPRPKLVAVFGKVFVASSGGAVTISSPNGTISVGGTLSNPALDIAQQGATVGQVLAWNGTKWAPVTGGGGGSVTITSPQNTLVVGGTTSNPTLDVAIGAETLRIDSEIGVRIGSATLRSRVANGTTGTTVIINQVVGQPVQMSISTVTDATAILATLNAAGANATTISNMQTGGNTILVQSWSANVFQIVATFPAATTITQVQAIFAGARSDAVWYGGVTTGVFTYQSAPRQGIANLFAAGANITLTRDANDITTIASTGGGGGTPGGANTQIQFNNSGTFGGSPLLTWNGSQLGTNVISSAVAQALSLRSDTGVRIADNDANFISLKGNSAGNSPTIATQGSDANIDLVLFGKGTGGLQLGSLANATPLIVTDAAVPTTLTPGSSGQVLTSAGAGKTPYWGSAGGSVSTLQGLSDVSIVEPIYAQVGTFTVASITPGSQSLTLTGSPTGLIAVGDWLRGGTSVPGQVAALQVIFINGNNLQFSVDPSPFFAVGNNVYRLPATLDGSTLFFSNAINKWIATPPNNALPLDALNWVSREGDLYVTDNTVPLANAPVTTNSTVITNPWTFSTPTVNSFVSGSEVVGIDATGRMVTGQYLDATASGISVATLQNVLVDRRAGGGFALNTVYNLIWRQGIFALSGYVAFNGTTITQGNAAVAATADTEIAAKIGSLTTNPVFPFTQLGGNVVSDASNFVGTACNLATSSYSTARAALIALGATPNAQAAGGLWTLPPAPLFVTNIANPTSVQYARVASIDEGVSTSQLIINITALNSYLDSLPTGAQPIFLTKGAFDFQSDPLAAIQRNTVASLNTLQGPVTVAAGTGIGIAASGNTLTVTNTGSSTPGSGNAIFFTDNQYGEALITEAATESLYIQMGYTNSTEIGAGGTLAGLAYFDTSTAAPTGAGLGIRTKVATTYTALNPVIYTPSYQVVFTTPAGASASEYSLDSLLFAKRTPTGNIYNNANLWPPFRDANPSDDIQLIPVKFPTFSVASSGTNQWTATIGEGIWDASFSGYTWQAGDLSVEYLGYLRIFENSGVSRPPTGVSITRTSGLGGIRLLASLPGTSGSTPTLSQVLTVGNTTGAGRSIIYQDSQATPNSINLSAPSSITSSYTLKLPSAQASAAGQVLANDGSGNLSWSVGGSGSNTTVYSTIPYKTSGGGQGFTYIDFVSLLGTDLPTAASFFPLNSQFTINRFSGTATRPVLTVTGAVTSPSANNYRVPCSGLGTFDIFTGDAAIIIRENSFLEIDEPLIWQPSNSKVGLEFDNTLALSSTSGVLQIARQGATNGQSLQWNGTSWVPATTSPNWLTGNGTPADGLGVVGNYYQDTSVTFPGNYIWLKTQTQTSPYWVRQTNLENAILSYNGGQLFFAFARVVATSAITLSGLQTIDGIALAAGDIVLATAQAPSTDSGLYTVSNGGWTRTTTTIVQGLVVIISLGTVNRGNSFIQTLPITSVALSAQAWSLFANNGAYSLQATCLVGNVTNTSITSASLTVNGQSGAGSLNLSSIAGAATISTATGGDSLAIAPGGAGNLILGNTANSGLTLAGGSTANAALTVTSGASSTNLTISAKGTSSFVNLGNGSPGFVQIQGNAVASPVSIAVSGNANQSLLLSPAGSGSTFVGNANAFSGISITGGQSAYTEVAANGAATNLNLVLTAKGTGAVTISNGSSSFDMFPVSSATAYNLIDLGSNELRIKTSSAGGLSIGNLNSDGTAATTLANLRVSASQIRLRAIGILTTTAIDATLEPQAAGNVDLGNLGNTGIRIAGGNSSFVNVQAVGAGANIDVVLTPKGTGDFYPIGSALSATTTNQPAILVASARGSTTLGVGTQGQVLTSNGTGGSPYWAASGLQGANMSVYTFAASPTGASAAALTLTNQINNLSLTLSTNSLTGFVANATYMIFMSFSWNGQNAAVNAFTSLTTTPNIVTTIGYGAGVSVSNIRTAATPNGDTTTVTNIGYYIPGATPATLYAYYFVGGSGTITNSTVTILRIA